MPLPSDIVVTVEVKIDVKQYMNVYENFLSEVNLDITFSVISVQFFIYLDPYHPTKCLHLYPP